MYPRALGALAASLFAVAGCIWAERMFRLRGVPRNIPVLRTSMIPNYNHVWFAHDLVYCDNMEGSLCAFGYDVAATGGNWSKLCRLDSDRDGETNGEELGDPCCRWTPAAPRSFSLASHFEYRRWGLSHPGADRDVAFAAKVGLPPLRPSTCHTDYDRTNYKSMFRDFYFRGADGPLESTKILFIKLASLAMLVALIAHWFLRKGLAGDICPWLAPNARLTSRTSLGVFAVAFAYMDLTSGILHLILDYAPHSLPVIGGLAKGFQYHHMDPTAIIRISWYEYVSHVHVLCPLIALIILLADVTRVQRLFWFWGAVFVHVFQTAHRWVHFRPDQLPWLVRLAQGSGLLLTHEKHMGHHEDLERQFTILAGHTDVFLDTLSCILLPQRYDLWVFVGISWFMLPFVVDIYFRNTFEGLDATRRVKDGVFGGLELTDKLG